MNILILTSRFGNGHMAAAKAIRARLLLQWKDANIEIVDLMPYIYPHIHSVIYKSFDYLVTRHPGIYNQLTRMDRHINRLSWRESFLRGTAIAALVRRFKPDLIINTWLLAPSYVSAYKRHYCDPIPSLTCVTDVGMHPEWIAPETDAYYVCDDNCRKELTALGVHPARVYVGQMPVDPRFRQKQKTDGACKRELLLVGGGLGLIPDAKKLIACLAAHPGVHLTVITGRNRKLYTYIREYFPSVHAILFTENMPCYVHKADAILTKPGGMTLFEAVASRTPIFVFQPFLTHEKENAAYILKNSIGGVIDPSDETALLSFLERLTAPDFQKSCAAGFNHIPAADRSLEELILRLISPADAKSTSCA